MTQDKTLMCDFQQTSSTVNKQKNDCDCLWRFSSEEYFFPNKTTYYYLLVRFEIRLFFRLILNISGVEQWTEISHYPAIDLRTAYLAKVSHMFL